MMTSAHSGASRGITWQPRELTIPGGALAWEEGGSGVPLLFLAGGPGDAAGYLRPLAEPLADTYRCVLLDQRGTGRSRLDRLDEETLALERFYDDIIRVSRELGVEQITLVGHSWGGMLALYFAMHHPARVRRMVLIGTGPLSDEGSAVAKANILKPLSAAERAELQALTARRHSAEKRGDWESAKRHHIESIRLRLRALFYDPAIAEQFIDDFIRDYSLNPTINRIVSAQAKQTRLFGNLSHISAPTLVIYGYQDFEPITQAYQLQAEMPNVTVRLINEAGHETWLEQPEKVQSEIRQFLMSTTSKE